MLMQTQRTQPCSPKRAGAAAPGADGQEVEAASCVHLGAEHAVPPRWGARGCVHARASRLQWGWGPLPPSPVQEEVAELPMAKASGRVPPTPSAELQVCLSGQ